MFQDTAVGIAFVDTFYDCLDKCQERDDCNWISYKDNGACYEYEKCTEKDPEAVDFQTTQIDCSSIGKLTQTPNRNESDKSVITFFINEKFNFYLHLT